MPGCLKVLPAGVLMAERHGVLGIGGVAARVDDHVEVGQLGHAGDDALHLLVGRVGACERLLRVLDERLHARAVLLQQLVVVEVGRLGQLVVALGAARGSSPSRAFRRSVCSSR